MDRLPPVMATILFLVAAVVGTALPLPARAAESFDNCTGFIDSLPASITTPGNWCLRRNLNTTINSGIAIHIAASRVTLDCNHFTIDGGWSFETEAYGVYAGSQTNIRIRNCNIRSFASGIFLDGDSSGIAPGYLVERNTLVMNTRHGIWVKGAGSTIRGNRVLTTGIGEPHLEDRNAYGITASNGVDVIDNTVNDVFVPVPSEFAVYGIRTIDNGAGSVIGNRIRGLAPWAGPANAVYGIYNHNSRGLIIRDNDIQGPGANVGGIGLRCSSTPATARDNVIAGFAVAVQKCMSIGNTVNTQ